MDDQRVLGDRGRGIVPGAFYMAGGGADQDEPSGRLASVGQCFGNA
jgi:hypothetical protein